MEKVRVRLWYNFSGYVRTLKAFFSWITREGYLESNPVARIPVPRAANKLINTFGFNSTK
jgi:site-specific recombinase XerD